MNNSFLCMLFVSCSALCSCGNQTDTTTMPAGGTEQQTSSAKSEAKDYCFRQVTGKDTFRAHLHVEDGKVSGNMDNIPDQKDARRGSITGIIVGDEIKAVWHFQQEGMNDSISLNFKLTKNALKQRPSIVNQSSGREEPDTKADYTISIPKVDCK